MNYQKLGTMIVLGFIVAVGACKSKPGQCEQTTKLIRELNGAIAAQDDAVIETKAKELAATASKQTDSFETSFRMMAQHATGLGAARKAHRAAPDDANKKKQYKRALLSYDSSADAIVQLCEK